MIRQKVFTYDGKNYDDLALFVEGKASFIIGKNNEIILSFIANKCESTIYEGGEIETYYNGTIFTFPYGRAIK